MELNDKKLKEWHTSGKDAYRSTSSMMRTNSGHPHYDTLEKRESVHDNNEKEGGYMFTADGRQRLVAKFGYTPEQVDTCLKEWIKGYKGSRAWYVKADAKHKAVLDSYAPIFKRAQEVAESVDVSDIRDGFPCGSAHLYLEYRERDTPLGKALSHFNRSGSPQYEYTLPIKMPNYGQCVAFDERICHKVQEFLRANGVLAHTYSWID
jgi:hypothetical protein